MVGFTVDEASQMLFLVVPTGVFVLRCKLLRKKKERR